MLVSYHPVVSDQDDQEETPKQLGAVTHMVPQSETLAPWNHVKDLDSFFTKIYDYHHKHGYRYMLLLEVVCLLQVLLVILGSSYGYNCFDYQILSGNVETNQSMGHHKITLGDAFIPLGQCVFNISLLCWILIVVSLVFWAFMVFRAAIQLRQYQDIRYFYNKALKIPDEDLDNTSWNEITQKILEVQKEEKMCINHNHTILDIYHRILRHQNYLVAMVNKNVLPIHFRVPIFGNRMVYLSQGLLFNLRLLFFWSPWSPFQAGCKVRDDYKKINKRLELKQQLSRLIAYFALINFILSPLILIWQILYMVSKHMEGIRREPSTLGSRRWSQYALQSLRHFNELQHELDARLKLAYRPANRYMTLFNSPSLTLIAKTTRFLTGGLMCFLLALSLYDSDFLLVEGVLPVITVLGGIAAACSAFIPDVNIVWCPETLMRKVQAHVHYLPGSWRDKAHTSHVRNEFSQLFQYRASFLLEELLSPIITPFIMIFWILPKAQEFVDFFRNFTVELVGVGDVCSFAQMDVRKHGNSLWHNDEIPTHPQPSGDLFNQADDGKTEKSLIYFKCTKPDWQPPAESEGFVSSIRSQAKQNFTTTPTNDVLNINTNSLSSLGVGLSEMLGRPTILTPNAPLSPTVVMNASLIEGPIQSSHYCDRDPHNDANEAAAEADNFSEMSLTMLYLQELHYRKMRESAYHKNRPWNQGASTSRDVQESTPLISHHS